MSDRWVGSAWARWGLPLLTLALYASLLARWFAGRAADSDAGMRSAPSWPLALLLLAALSATAFVHRDLLRRMAAEAGSVWRLPRRELALVTAVIVLSFVYQLPTMLYPAGIVDSDSAINGLMALHIADGRVAPAFYYGAIFAGTFFSHVLALVFVITGPFAAGLPFVAWLFYSGFLVGGYLLTRQAAGAAVALIVALWLAAPPPDLLTTLVYAEYSQLLLFSIWALVVVSACCAGLLRQPAWWAVAGVLLGLGFWAHGLTIVVAAAIGSSVLVFLPLRRVVPAAVLLGLGFLLGLLPGLVGWGSELGIFLEWFVTGGDRGTGATAVEAIAGLWRVSLGSLMLGVRESVDLPIWRAAALSLVLAGSVGWGIGRGALYVWRERRTKEPGETVLRQAAVAFPLAMLVTLQLGLMVRYAYEIAPFRYLLPLYLAIPALVAVALHALAAARLRWAVPLTLAVVAAWGGLVLPASVGVLREMPEKQRAFDESVAALREAGVAYCLAPYWDAYRLSYLTLEQILCESTGPQTVPFYERVVQERSAGRMPDFVARRESDQTWREHSAYLEAEGIPYTAVETPVYIALIPR